MAMMETLLVSLRMIAWADQCERLSACYRTIERERAENKRLRLALHRERV